MAKIPSLSHSEDDREMDGPLSTQSAYDRWATDYNDADPSTILDEPFVLSMVQPLDGCRVLDLGCGTGRYLRLAGQGASAVVGMDLSRAMLARARRQTERSLVARWVQASVEHLPFVEGAFDRVVSGLVLDHVERLDRYFDGVARVLRPGGRAVVTAVHPEMQRLTGSLVQFQAGGQTYRTEGTIHEIVEILEAARRAGLSVDRCEEPPVDERLVAHRSDWRNRLGCPALLLLALSPT